MNFSPQGEGSGKLTIAGQEFDLDEGVDLQNIPPANFEQSDDSDAAAGTEDGGKQAAATDPAVEAMRVQLARQEQEITELRGRGFNRSADSQDAPATQPAGGGAATPEQLDAYKKQLETSFYKDPGGTLLTILATAEQSAINKMRGSFVDQGARTGTLLVDSFKQGQRVSDPNFTPAVEAAFDKMIAGLKLEEMSNINLQNLDILRKIAIGEAAITANATGTRENAPPRALAAGSAQRSVQVSESQQGAKRGKLTKEDVAMVVTAREMGMSEADIQKMLKEAD